MEKLKEVRKEARKNNNETFTNLNRRFYLTKFNIHYCKQLDLNNMCVPWTLRCEDGSDDANGKEQ